MSQKPTKPETTTGYKSTTTTPMSEQDIQRELKTLPQDFGKVATSIPSSAAALQKICTNVQKELETFYEYYQKKDVKHSQSEIEKLDTVLSDLKNKSRVAEVLKGVQPESFKPLVGYFERLNQCLTGIQQNIAKGSSSLGKDTTGTFTPSVQTLTSDITKVISNLETHTKPKR